MTEDYPPALTEILDFIDRRLGETGMHPSERPFQAAITLAQDFITEVSTGGETKEVPNDTMSIMVADWFKLLLRSVTDWYRRRYGARMDEKVRGSVHGVILIYGTPFGLKVPTTTSRPGEPGVTAWIRFPDEVLPSEKPLAWILDAPDLSQLQQKERRKLRELLKEIATNLRRVRVALTGVKTDPKVDELKGGILSQLERAAHQIGRADEESIKRAFWDIQMACEHALKLLAQQRSGKFRRTHDLFLLYDSMPGGSPGFNRVFLSRLPNWERMAELRYGAGGRVRLDEAFAAYRTALKVIAATVEGLERMRLGKAEFLIRKAPWLQDEEAD